MRQPQNNVSTPSGIVICDRGLGFVVLISKNLFLEKRLVFLQATHYIYPHVIHVRAKKKCKTASSKTQASKFPALESTPILQVLATSSSICHCNTHVPTEADFDAMAGVAALTRSV